MPRAAAYSRSGASRERLPGRAEREPSVAAGAPRRWDRYSWRSFCASLPAIVDADLTGATASRKCDRPNPAVPASVAASGVGSRRASQARGQAPSNVQTRQRCMGTRAILRAAARALRSAIHKPAAATVSSPASILSRGPTPASREGSTSALCAPAVVISEGCAVDRKQGLPRSGEALALTLGRPHTCAVTLHCHRRRLYLVSQGQNEKRGAVMKVFVAGATGVLGRELVPPASRRSSAPARRTPASSSRGPAATWRSGARGLRPRASSRSSSRPASSRPPRRRHDLSGRLDQVVAGHVCP